MQWPQTFYSSFLLLLIYIESWCVTFEWLTTRPIAQVSLLLSSSVALPLVTVTLSSVNLNIFTRSFFLSLSPAGYLMQMLLQLNHTDKNNGSMGLELAIVEGEYDSLLPWPFRWVNCIWNVSRERERERKRKKKFVMAITFFLHPLINRPLDLSIVWTMRLSLHMQLQVRINDHKSEAGRDERWRWRWWERCRWRRKDVHVSSFRITGRVKWKWRKE